MYTHSTVKKTSGQNSQNFVQELSTLSPTFSSMSAINYLKTGNFVFASIFSRPAQVRLNVISMPRSIDRPL